MGLNKNFGTDPKRESEGAWFELDEDTKVKLRRAGGGNKEYEKLHTKLLQPHMRRLRMTQGKRIPPGLEEPLKEIQRVCYARTSHCQVGRPRSMAVSGVTASSLMS
jgi:hypothetical protein